jgi:two-component system chemotaxis sensor kinase CheA
MEAFVEEGQEHLATIEGDVLALEKGDRDEELVNRVFRAMHTIKGGAGFLGLQNIKALSHSLESVLSALREGQLSAASGKALPSLLLEGVRQWCPPLPQRQ